LLCAVSYSSTPIRRDDLDAVRTDTRLTNTEQPTARVGFVYVITAESAGGDEGSLGTMSCAEGSDIVSCP
jgi:hypothetical protein